MNSALLRSPWTTTIADAISGALDSAAPRALWRLIQIGETAGLVTPAHQNAILDAFGDAERRRESLNRVLLRSQCGVTELYILVALLAADPRSVSVKTLARETLANSGSLRFALQRLETLAAISTNVGGPGNPAITLTSSGRGLSVILIHAALRAAIAPTPVG